jgi:hypothetical protein
MRICDHDDPPLVAFTRRNYRKTSLDLDRALVSDKPFSGPVRCVAIRRSFPAAASLAAELMTAPSFPGIPEHQPTWFVESANEFFERGL